MCDPLGYFYDGEVGTEEGFAKLVKEARKVIVDWSKLGYDADGVALERLCCYRSVNDAKQFYYNSMPGICYDETLIEKLAYGDMTELVKLRLGKLRVTKKPIPSFISNDIRIENAPAFSSGYWQASPAGENEGLLHDVREDGRAARCTEGQKVEERNHTYGGEVPQVQGQGVQDRGLGCVPVDELA